MGDWVLLDNDVVIKLCFYGLVDEYLAIMKGKSRESAILMSSKFAIRKQIERKKGMVDNLSAVRGFDRIIKELRIVEASEIDVARASEFEEQARLADLPLHSGESLLLALLLNRPSEFSMIATGDKRALEATELLAEQLGFVDEVNHRFGCFEQVVFTLLTTQPLDVVRRKICSEAAADKAIASCFSCAGIDVRRDSVLEGLRSYIASVRRTAGNVLVPGEGLVAS